MAKGKPNHHVVPNKNSESEKPWAVIKEGSRKPSGTYNTKQEAVDAGRKMSDNQGTELFIHGQDGKIQKKDSHGNDPYPPKG